MATVKDSWKKVGADINELGKDIKSSDLGKNMKQLGKDFGKSVVKTVKHGIKSVSEWAASEDDEPEEPIIDAEPEVQADPGEEAEAYAEEAEVKED